MKLGTMDGRKRFGREFSLDDVLKAQQGYFKRYGRKPKRLLLDRPQLECLYGLLQRQPGLPSLPASGSSDAFAWSAFDIVLSEPLP